MWVCSGLSYFGLLFGLKSPLFQGYGKKIHWKRSWLQWVKRGGWDLAPSGRFSRNRGRVSNSGWWKPNQKQTALVRGQQFPSVSLQSAGVQVALLSCIRFAVYSKPRCFSVGKLWRFCHLRNFLEVSCVSVPFRKLYIHTYGYFTRVSGLNFRFIHSILSILTHPSSLSWL